MQFAVGYQLPGGETTADIVRDYREHIAEVYFPWVGMASFSGYASSARNARRGLA